ncbi:MAG: hypothetical protein PF572_04995 [Patescibacteria group bacterium]|jgi:uncharacterized membrane protein|nr:hypothetical protein [Patescibacteria group bacterium]
MKKIFIIIIIFVFSFAPGRLLSYCDSPSLLCNIAHAQKEGDLSLEPKVIDDSVAPRAMLEYSVVLKNNTTHKLNIYPLLEDLDEGEKKISEGLLDREYLMTKWISIKRNAIDISPGEEYTLPIKIDVSHDAIPDEYFVSITFAHGAHRVEAEENAVKTSPPKLFINLKVEDQTIEKASILKYYPSKKIFIDPRPVLFLELNNSGNVDLAPKGNVYLYNKRGEEVDIISINPEFKTAAAGKIFTLELRGNNNLKTGKYKARMEIEYGEKISKEIQDTVYVIVATLPFLLFFGIGISLFIILLSALIFKRTYHYKHSESKAMPERIKVIKEGSKEEKIINLKSK